MVRRFFSFPCHARSVMCGTGLFLTLVLVLALLPLRASAAELLVSPSSDRSSPQSLETAPLQDQVYLFVGDASAADQVRFYLDGTLVKTENRIPWDFAGTTPDDLAYPYDTRDLVDGNYRVSAELYQEGSVVQTLQGLMEVANQPPPESGGEAVQLHTGWQSDPSGSLAVMWFSPLAGTPATVSYRRAGESVWEEASGVVSHSTADGQYLQVNLEGLLADTRYEFRAALAPDVWSRVYQSYTAPAPGPADFDAIFVADTGLVGRLDGLATGTEQVILEIARRNPGFVLLGGDYAYFNTDKRYVTLERSIAAWFDQMSAIASQSPMMPTYGNHEVLLGEGFDTWVNYFVTPEGWNGRRMYSFDAGEAHFVSIFGLNEYEQLPQEALDWLSADLAAAKSRGQRWLVPYMHAAPFSEGTNHPSALPLRDQLGPVFEAAGVQVVLTAHDQSYERTYPLVNVPATNTPTSVNRHCYGPEDGVSWLKVAPGGKLSNISLDFSPWRTSEPPAWTVFRNNTLHHFAHLSVTATGTLKVDVFGVEGDGSVPLQIDRVRYAVNGCAPEVLAQPRQVALLAEPGEVVSESLNVTGGDGAALDFEITQIPGWLSPSQVSGVTPASVELVADASGLAVGEYRGILQITAGEDLATWVPVVLRVGASRYGLWVSNSPDRAGAVRLEGALLQGEQYIFTSPDTDVSKVRFYMDDPTGTGVVTKTENVPPFDLAGTAADDTAYPYDTGTLADGGHELGARLTISGGLEVLVSAVFMVANDVPQLDATPDSVLFGLTPPQSLAQQDVLVQMTDGSNPNYSARSTAAWLGVEPITGVLPETLALTADASALSSGQYQADVVIETETGEQLTVPVSLVYDQPSLYTLAVSLAADRSNPVPLDGSNLSGEVYIFVPDIEGMKKVAFYLDDPDRLGSPIKVENRAPWDFAGTVTQPPRDAYGFSLEGLAGQHVITAVITDAGGDEVVHGVFDVSP